MIENKIACVVVGFPATPIVSARVRFCLSASHTLEQIDYVLEVTDKLGDILALRHSFQNSLLSRYQLNDKHNINYH